MKNTAKLSYEELIDRQRELLAHPEHSYRVAEELREVDEALAEVDQMTVWEERSERRAELAATQYFASRGL